MCPKNEPVPQILGEFLHERIAERSQIVHVPVPQILEISQERVQQRTAETVGGACLQELCRGRQNYPSGANFRTDAIGETRHREGKMCLFCVLFLARRRRKRMTCPSELRG